MKVVPAAAQLHPGALDFCFGNFSKIVKSWKVRSWNSFIDDKIYLFISAFFVSVALLSARSHPKKNCTGTETETISM